MVDGCIGNCRACGKCGDFDIPDGFHCNTRSLEPRAGHGIAVDIGTTSVAMALLDLSDGTVMARLGFMNPQRAVGPDVISRIEAANNGRLEDMRHAVAVSVAEGVEKLTKQHGIPQIIDMVISGNTVMTYLLLGLSCESLGVFPFKPQFSASGSHTLPDIRCPVRIVPWLAAFVGGDVTSGLLNVLQYGARRFMLIDLGTNGELALYNNGNLTVTSTAAGPVFEGGRQPGGASGVIDSLARLIRERHVDKTGLLADNAPGVFTQKEMRDLQLAKSAVRSGFEILLETAGLEYGALDAVYLAGGIGQALDIDSAITVGLLPGGLRDKVRAVGNASLGGAARMLLEPESAASDLERLLLSTSGINLAEHPKFNDYFMENIFFPSE